jgi:hypothetical protein
MNTEILREGLREEERLRGKLREPDKTEREREREREREIE